MTATDPFTAACPVYRNAMRHCTKTGEAFEVTGKRSLPLPLKILCMAVSFASVAGAVCLAIQIVGW